ncbi:MAG: hypothetical protein M3O30_08115 [Planctomycetota bacterium]|nr:hypothetical protein [Planctomycetota bacterium]
MATQEGFAGALMQSETDWLWKREIDYQPPTGNRDIGRLEFTDPERKLMIEEGVDQPYTEVWERIDDAASTGGEAWVLKLEPNANDERGLLIAVGNHFMLALDRRKKGDGATPDVFNMEISHGKRAGPVSQWIISDSIFPWREGQCVFGESPLVIDWDRRLLIESRVWSIVEPTVGCLDWIQSG